MLKKIFIGFGFVLIAWYSASGQVKNSIDVEYTSLCMIDSISASSQVYFTRVFNNSLKSNTYDINQAGTGSYTPVGTVKPCPYANVVKECWLKQQTVNYINYVYTADPEFENEDAWVVDLVYLEQKSVSSYANPQSPLTNMQHVPLAYPYGNTQAEADRFTHDIQLWLDCMGICYKDDSPYESVATPTGLNTAYPSLNGLRVSITVFGIEFVNIYYSRNFTDPGRYTYARAGTKTTGLSYLCDQPFDLYRRINDGQPAWGVNYKGQVEFPPYTGLLTKVSCDFLDNRRDDCSRPSGSNETWVAAVDTPLCNYYLNIPANENITGLWLRGVNIIGGTYEPDGGGGAGKDVQDLTDTINNYIYKRNGIGKFAINNIQTTQYGWNITGKYSNYSFDSVQTNIKTYYPTVNGCINYKIYNVTRNDLGGILNCVDEQGDRRYLPESAVQVFGDDINSVFDCQNGNRCAFEIVANATKVYDLSKYHCISYYVQLSTGVSVSIKNKAGGTETFAAPVGYTESFKAEDKCNYMKGLLTIVVGNGGRVKVSYIW